MRMLLTLYLYLQSSTLLHRQKFVVAEEYFCVCLFSLLGIQMKTIDLQNDDDDKSITRSGRRVKPPMQFWCGERIRLDQELNVTINKGGANYLSPVRFLFLPICKLLFWSDDSDRNFKQVHVDILDSYKLRILWIEKSIVFII